MIRDVINILLGVAVIAVIAAAFVVLRWQWRLLVRQWEVLVRVWREDRADAQLGWGGPVFPRLRAWWRLWPLGSAPVRLREVQPYLAEAKDWYLFADAGEMLRRFPDADGWQDTNGRGG